MFSKRQNLTAQAAIEIERNLFRHLAEKYGGESTLNELRVMNQIIRCHLKGRFCSVTALHKITDIPIPTVSRAVANLQADGWLCEKPDEFWLDYLGSKCVRKCVCRFLK